MITLREVDPGLPQMRALIEANQAHGLDAGPSESDHTFGVEDLRGDGIRFWGLFDGDTPLGCGALKPLPDGTAEVKSVFVAETARGRGCARRIMDHLAEAARQAGHRALVLETGSDLCPEYTPARRLYETLGYVYCAPIFGYGEDPNSAFMRLPLDPVA